MLNKGLQSEQDQRINGVLEKLTTLSFLPDTDQIEKLEQLLHKIGMWRVDLKNFSPEELNLHLKKFNFNWEQLEQFADILVKWSVAEPDFRIKGKAMYVFIQEESKMFSFEIMNKISHL